ncbi:unnamed protein product, partial [Ectocarpus sp. 8 AP-2014]
QQLKACKKQDKVLRAELGLRVEAEQDQRRVVCGELSGSCTSIAENGHSQPVLSGVMGSLDRVRRTHHSMSSPGFLAFAQAERHHLKTAPDRQARDK